MILAVAGTQLPFPRLTTALDDIAGRIGVKVLAQTADPHFTGRAIQSRAFLPAAEFDRAVAEAELIVGHAGIGVIMAAAEWAKPLIIMPRRAALSEHRNDHQLATAQRFGANPGITVVHDAAELERSLISRNLRPVEFGADSQLQSLIEAVATAIG